MCGLGPCPRGWLAQCSIHWRSFGDKLNQKMKLMGHNLERDIRRGGANPSPTILMPGGGISRRASRLGGVSGSQENSKGLQTETILQVSNRIGVIKSIGVLPTAEVPVQVWPFPYLWKRSSIEECGRLDLTHVLTAVDDRIRGFFSNKEEQTLGLAPRQAVSAHIL